MRQSVHPKQGGSAYARTRYGFSFWGYENVPEKRGGISSVVVALKAA
jgi:hypothetical protein